MKRKDIGVGAIIEIPSSSGAIIEAKILYISKVYTNVILLGLRKKGYEINFEEPSCFYTSIQPIVKDRWKLLKADSLLEQEENKALRIVANDVWLNDNYIRTASDEDMYSLPQMDVFGAKLIEIRANKFT